MQLPAARELQRLQAALQEAEDRAALLERESLERERAEAQEALQLRAALEEEQRIVARREAEAREAQERQEREARERQARERNPEQALARCTLRGVQVHHHHHHHMFAAKLTCIALTVLGSVAVDWNADAPGNDGAQTWREAYRR